MKGQRLQWSIHSDVRKSPEGKEVDAHLLRRRAGAELYSFLLQYRLPAVIDIEEESIPARENEFYDTFNIGIAVTPVAHQHVTVTDVVYSYDLQAPSRLKMLWFRILRMIRRA